MLFHTWIFLVFFIVVYTGFLLVRTTRFRLPWLLAASYVFYGWWNPIYLVLIVWSTTVDFLAVLAMAKTKWRRRWLALSIANNLGMLAFFKYGQFLVDNINKVADRLQLPFELSDPKVTFLSDAVNGMLGWLHVPYVVPSFDYLLPVGISFYVFQSMSYTIDFYRGQIKREPSFVRYATFVSFFPQLVAGPIERASNLLPQLHGTPRVTRQDVADGLSLFVVGLFKKIALADYLALYVNPVYASPQDYNAAALALATFAFAWQIYFDFSGYTDMARGVGRLLGVRLMLNFDNPYLATGLGDFWRRWHISLSTWFRDYVYIPLGGNRLGDDRTYVNMVLTMLISGLWHGAMWTFVLWGAVHAVGRVLTRSFEQTRFYRDYVPVLAKQVLTFLIVTLAWVFFRAQNIDDAWLILDRIFTSGWRDPGFPLLLAVMVLSIWLYQYIYESKMRVVLESATVRMALVVAMILFMMIFVTSGNEEFIYFRF